ncbi:MAG TPA: cupin domain-containing protein [Acidimicrobiales bacterium]|nr:cupin domain-containing protein [Acidimicrobiales bacterium]
MPDAGGDAACWAGQVCDACGGVLGPVHRCTRRVHLDHLRPGAGADGVVWSLAGDRQLDVNLVVLGPGSAIGEHDNDVVDVCLVVLSGSATLVVDGLEHALSAHELAFVPRGARRAITAGSEGVRYLSTHVARAGPAIRTP